MLGPAVLLSHTGVKAVCGSPRNAEDETLRRIAEVGGIIGVGFYAPAVCGDDWVLSFVRSVRHVVDVTGGIDAVALGSDWDGTVEAMVPADQTGVLVDALLTIGNFSEQDVERILFSNAIRFLRDSLPVA